MLCKGILFLLFSIKTSFTRRSFRGVLNIGALTRTMITSISSEPDNQLENLLKEMDIVEEDIADNKKSLKIAKQDNNNELVLVCIKLASRLNNVYAELLAEKTILMNKGEFAGIYRNQFF